MSTTKESEVDLDLNELKLSGRDYLKEQNDILLYPKKGTLSYCTLS